MHMSRERLIDRLVIIHAANSGADDLGNPDRARVPNADVPDRQILHQGVWLNLIADTILQPRLVQVAGVIGPLLNPDIIAFPDMLVAVRSFDLVLDPQAL